MDRVRYGRSWCKHHGILPSSSRELPPPGNIMHIERCIYPEWFLGNHSLASGWGFWHMNNSREDIFEQVRLLLCEYQKADLLCYRVKPGWKKGLKPHRLARRIEVWESIVQQEATQTPWDKKLRTADHVRVFDEVTGGLSDNSSPMRLDGEHLSLAELSWILVSDPPLSELYLEALRILASCITPDTLCIFCQKSFAFFVFGIHLPSSWLPCPTSSHPDSG